MARPTSKTLLVATLGTVILVTGGLWLWTVIKSSRYQAEIEDLPRVPPGRWHVDLLESLQRSDAEARLLSLPYLAGTRVATKEGGVRAFHPERAYPGLNFYVSGHAPEAILLDLEGQVLHRWRFTFEEAFPDRARAFETEYWRRAQLLPGGEIIAIFQGNGMVKLDRDSNLLWAIDQGFYNDLEIGPRGEIYGLGKQATVIPGVRDGQTTLEDSIVVIDASGRVESRISIWKALLDSPYAELATPMPDIPDIFHSNTVEYLDGRGAERSPILRRGNLLISLREVDIVAILDPRTERIVWAARGPWDAQHQPTLLDSGRILLFDNLGVAGRSRVLEFEPPAAEILGDYRGPVSRPLFSAMAGTAQRLPNGNTLITESEGGRAYEVTPEGDVVWDFVSPHRAGPDDRLVATLFEVVRLEHESGLFLEEGS